VDIGRASPLAVAKRRPYAIRNQIATESGRQHHGQAKSQRRHRRPRLRAEFIPIYQKHPNANMYALCQRTEKKLQEVGDAFKIAKRYTKYEDVLADKEVDFVHINSPIPDHARNRSRP